MALKTEDTLNVEKNVWKKKLVIASTTAGYRSKITFRGVDRGTISLMVSVFVKISHVF